VHGRKPDLRHFKRYGCAAWVLKRGSYKEKGILRDNSLSCMRARASSRSCSTPSGGS
jgi:hypothetical protein